MILVPRNFLRQELDGPQKLKRMDVSHKFILWRKFKRDPGLHKVGSRHPTLSAIFFFLSLTSAFPTVLPGLREPDDRRVRVDHSETAAR